MLLRQCKFSKLFKRKKNNKHKLNEGNAQAVSFSYYATRLQNTSSSYPSIFWLVVTFPSAIFASHSFHCCITGSFCVLATCVKYRSRGLPISFFPDIAPSRMFTTNSLCLTVCPIHEWGLFFTVFKSNLSSFALWKTRSFVILSVHFIYNILLQLHVSNAFTTLNSFDRTRGFILYIQFTWIKFWWSTEIHWIKNMENRRKLWF